MSRFIYRKKDGSRRLNSHPALLLFAVLLVGFSIVNWFWPKRTLSELENRKLAQMPKFEWSAFLNGQWPKAFTSYVQDQVAGRDGWIDLQSAVNTLVFQQVEQSNILLGSDGRLFTKLFSVPDGGTQFQKNTNAVAEFAARHPGKVTFLLAPSASVIYADELPFAAPMIDENTMLDEAFSTVGQSAAVVDLRDLYSSLRDEPLYFKTDHHWTTNGAYRAYEQFCTLRGLTPFDRDVHEAVTVEDFYGTHYSAARPWNGKPDNIVYYPLPNTMTIYEVGAEGQYTPLKTENLINTDKFDTRDKYAAFLDGNNGYSVVEGNGTGSILVVKDSYANSFVPYLTANYAKIGVIDYRAFKYGLDSVMQTEGYDEVLILYNFQTFLSDTNVVYLNRPSTVNR